MEFQENECGVEHRRISTEKHKKKNKVDVEKLVHENFCCFAHTKIVLSHTAVVCIHFRLNPRLVSMTSHSMWEKIAEH